MTVTRDYTENRFYKITPQGTPNLPYSDLVRKNTSFNVTNQGDTSTNAFIDTSLYNFFDIHHFISQLGGTTITINTSLTTKEAIIDNLLTSGSYSDYKNYIDEITTIHDSNEYILDKHIANLAKEISHFFMISSALYTLIYSTDIISAETYTPSQAIIKTTSDETEVGLMFSFTNYVGDADTATQKSSHTNLIRAYYESMADLKLMTEASYAANLSKNIELNKRFNSFDSNLDTKQNNFDHKRAFVITMMSKTHKASKLYSKKRLMFYIYLSLFLVYAFICVGVLLAGSSNYEVFESFQNALTGLYIVILNVCLLLALFLYEFITYLYR